MRRKNKLYLNYIQAIYILKLTSGFIYRHINTIFINIRMSLTIFIKLIIEKDDRNLESFLCMLKISDDFIYPCFRAWHAGSFD